MTWPNQNTTNESSAGALLLSNAIAAGITSAGGLSQLALIQEAISNLLIESPAAWVLNTTGAGTVGAFTCTTAVAGSVTSSGLIKSTSVSAGVGYATGAGGLATQAANKTTAVVLNKICGQIVGNNAALAAAAEATYTVTNTSCAAGDVVIANHASGGTSGSYTIQVSNVVAGAFDITLGNVNAGALTEAVTVGFAIIKGVTA